MMSLSSLQPVKKKMLSSTQPVVTSVVIWSREWKLNLNADKSEIFPFSTWSNNSNWNPTIFIDTQKVRVNTTHRFFGAILDRNLTFNAHSKTLTASVTSSIRIIRTAHTSWGWHRSTLKKACHALVHSKLDYAAPAWQPWLSITNLSCLDCLQSRSLWLIMGQLISTRLEALHLEANVQSYTTCRKRLILKTKEKALHRTDNHPRCIALNLNIPQHLQNCSSFGQKAEELSTLLPPDLQHRQKIIHFPSLPWQQSASHEGQISTSVLGITDWADGSNLIRQCSVTTIALYQADYVIYTDRFASRGTRNEGAAAVATRGSLSSLKWVTPSKRKEGFLLALMSRKLLPWNPHYPGIRQRQPSLNLCTLQHRQ